MPKAGIGRIKWFDPENKRGVIAPEEMGRKEKSYAADLFFEASDDDAPQLRVGQLVQFVVEGEGADAQATNVIVLSQKA